MSVFDFLSGDAEEKPPQGQAAPVTESAPNTSSSAWKSHAADMAKAAYVGQLPGAGTLYTYNITDGFSLTRSGQTLALIAGAFGLYAMVSR